jgi:fructoselysine 6-kinase
MKLLGLGDNVMDAYLFRGELYPGGNAANVAALARRAGAEGSGYLGVLANDAAGLHFRRALEQEGVDLSRLRTAVGTTSCNTIALGPGGDRVFTGNNGGETVQKCFAPVLTPADRAYAASFDVVHSSIHSGLDGALAGLARHSDVSMDFSSDGFTHDNVARLAPVLRFAFFSCGGRTEAQAREFAAFAASCGIDEVIFTLGPRGSFGISRGKLWQAGACPVTAVDTLGAGDAYIAAFLAEFFSNGGDAPRSAARAARFAAECCLHYGAFGHPLSIKESGLFPRM